MGKVSTIYHTRFYSLETANFRHRQESRQHLREPCYDIFSVGLKIFTENHNVSFRFEVFCGLNNYRFQRFVKLGGRHIP